MQVVNLAELKLYNFSNPASFKVKEPQMQNNKSIVMSDFSLSGRPLSYISFGSSKASIANRVADRVKGIHESGIRSVTRKAVACGAVNLGQGTPTERPPEAVRKALMQAMKSPENSQYTNTWGIQSFREAIACKYEHSLGRKIDPNKEITVTCGGTEGMNDVINALVNPGEKVIMFEPFYDNFTPNVLMAGGVPEYVKIRPKDGSWKFDPKVLEAAFEKKPKAIIINSPQNPSGKVLSEDELKTIAKLCKKHNVIAVTDEIYENVLYDGKKHVSMASISGMKDRTVVVSGLSKSYSATGWRIGYVIAPPVLTEAIRKVHDFTTLCLPGAYQKAGEAAMNLPDSYYKTLGSKYQQKRDFMMKTLVNCGFEPYKPEGSYFVLAGIKPLCKKLGLKNDIEFTDFLMNKVGVAMIPGSNFFKDKKDGKWFVRVSFCKDMDILKDAAQRLKKIADFSDKKLA